jgi:hypothetical protein
LVCVGRCRLEITKSNTIQASSLTGLLFYFLFIDHTRAVAACHGVIRFGHRGHKDSQL